MTDSISRLHAAVRAAKARKNGRSRTAKLLRDGKAKIAKKLAEEAVEVAIEAVRENRGEIIRESADLLYNLIVLWVEAGLKPEDIWSEMDRREKVLGIAEKVPKRGLPAARRRAVAVKPAARKPSRRKAAGHK